MTAFGGAGIPKIVRDANAVLEKLKVFAETAKLKPTTKELVGEAQLAITGLKQHAKDEFKRGYELGKSKVFDRITEMLDPDREQAE